MKIVFVTISQSAINAFSETNRKCKDFDPALDLKVISAIDELTAEETAEMHRSILNADLTFIDLMGAPVTTLHAVREAAAKAEGHIVPFGSGCREYMRLGAFGGMGSAKGEGKMSSDESKKPSMESMKKMQNMAEKIGKIIPGKMRDMRNYSLMMKYFHHGTQKNYDNLILLILKEYGNIKGIKVEDPEIHPPITFFDFLNGRYLNALDMYEEAVEVNPERPGVAVFFSSTNYPIDTGKAVAAMSKRLSQEFNVYAIAFTGNFAEVRDDLENVLEKLKGKLSLLLNCMPFRLGAGPMGGDADSAVKLLERLDLPYLHPFFLTRKTTEDWMRDPRGCSVGETLISVILPELDGSQETMPVASLNRERRRGGSESIELDVIPERLEHLMKRVRALIRLRHLPNREKRVAILCYNYPPGESNLFGGAFLDTFKSIERILKTLVEEGYQTDALASEDLMKHFSMGGMVNDGKYESDYNAWTTFSPEEYRSTDETDRCWGRKPGNIMTHRGKILIPGIMEGNVWIGLQPSRGRGISTDSDYHDKSVPPHHQYAAYYQWIENVFRADVLIHVGTHGTVEFLKGKEIGMSGSCYPDLLIGSMPHIYLYYVGNPAEGVVAKRRSHANLVSYMPPVFVESGLHGELLELQTELENYEHTRNLNPQAEAEMRGILVEKAKKLGLSEDLHEMESELLRYQSSLIPMGLHIFGEAYSDDEQAEYEKGVLRMYRISEEHEEAGGATEDNALKPGAGRSPEHRGGLPIDVAEKLKSAQKREEMNGLLRALRGGYSAARLGGDIYRSLDVLPSGFNLYQFDPRLVPSKLAMKRGREICRGTLDLFLKEKASYPESIAVILWGLETSRTQGETLGQILAYLGVELAPDSSSWNRKFRVIPIEELNRPRIDVTVNICGFFRDMFPDIIEDLSDVFEQVLALDETEEQNYLKKHSAAQRLMLLEDGYSEAEADEFSKIRMFGPREGEYGTSLTGLIESKEWEKEEALGFAFTASLRHAYTRTLHGKEIAGLYETNLKAVEIVSQLRSSNEYEITDLDHYYEFFGGLAKSVEMVRGSKAQMYISDTTQGKNVTETVNSAINRGLRTRVLNPKWSDALLSHQYHGGQEIAQRFENVMGLAATTGAVEQELFHDLEASYVADEEMSRRMEENNPHAYMDILEQMMEYYERGYWDASEEQLDRIRKAYLRVEDSVEE